MLHRRADAVPATPIGAPAAVRRAADGWERLLATGRPPGAVFAASRDLTNQGGVSG